MSMYVIICLFAFITYINLGLTSCIIHQQQHTTLQSNPDYLNLIWAIMQFLSEYADVDMFVNYECGPSLYDYAVDKDNNNILFNIFSHSGKGFNELGLENECNLVSTHNLSYFLILYQYEHNSYSFLSDDRNVFMFLNRSSFYTGVCIISECEAFINDVFNRTLNPKLFTYLQNEINITNITYLPSNNAFPSETHTTEYKIYNVLKYIVISLIIIQFVLLIAHVINYAMRDDSNNQHKKDTNSDSISNDILYDSDEDDEYSDNNYLQRKRSLRKEKHNNNNNMYSLFGNKSIDFDDFNDNTNNTTNNNGIRSCTCKSFMNKIFDIFNAFNNVKLLTSKHNLYYNEEDLEIISFFKVVVLLFMTLLQNIETIIKIPARDFSNEEFYTSIWFIFLKLASYSIDCFIALEGFVMIYKLMFYIKTHSYTNSGKVTINVFICYYLHVLSKVITFIFIYFSFAICVQYVMWYFSNNSLYQYFITQIYDDDVHKWLLEIIIPFYNFVFAYANTNANAVHYDKLYAYNRFLMMYVNLFYVFTLAVIIMYISVKLKSKLYDTLITLIIIANTVLTFYTTPSETYTQHDIYNFTKVIRGLFNIRYPHIMCNHYFIGMFCGLICFYHKDVISGFPINEQEGQYSPFKLCYNITQWIDSLSTPCKVVVFYFNCVVLVTVAMNFKVLLLCNSGQLVMRFSNVIKSVFLYERTLFLTAFTFLVVLLQTNNEESSIKHLMSAKVFNTVTRIDICYVSCLSMIVSCAFCTFNFQMKLSYQNLWFLSFGLFVLGVIFSLILTVFIEVPCRIIIKDVIHVVTRKYNDNKRINNSNNSNSNSNDINTTKDKVISHNDSNHQLLLTTH